MSAKLSIDQALMKANSHAKKDEILEAQRLYQAVLLAFPQNISAQQGLANLDKANPNNVNKSPPKEIIDQLISLYNQGQFLAVVEQAKALTDQYPEIFMIWNILGTSAVRLKMLDEAIEAYKKCILLKPDYTEAYINMGVALKDQGKLDEAIDAYKKSISLKPDYAVSYSNMGNALKDQGKLDEAIEAYNKALSLKPDYADVYINMGNALKDQGKFDNAIEAYNKCIALKPDYAVAYNNIGKIFQEHGKLDDAIEAYKKCILLKPDYPETYIQMGNALKGQGKLDDAIEAYNKCIALKPDYAVAHNNIGKAFQEQYNLDEAIEAYNKSISIQPDYPDPYINMGNALQERCDVDEAIEFYKKALSLKPDYAEAYNNMGVALKDQGKVEESIEAYNRCITIKPDYAEAYNNMGMTLQYQGKLNEAKDAYKKAISLKPDYALAHKNLTYSLLNSGSLQEGLDEYEWRWKTDKFLLQQRNFSQPLWDGKESLHDKRILLWCEQGIGDTINWSSSLSLISSWAKHCILECQEKLVPLLKRSFPNVDVKTENKRLDTKRDDFDVHLPMGSLYKHFYEEIIKKPKAEVFLIPDPFRVKFWKERLNALGNGPYIGISWKSSVMTTLRGPNYSSISEWSPILKIPNVNFINMQYVDFENDLNKIKNELGHKIHNFDDLDHFNNIDDVAALCAALDMVVSNKTTVPLISAAVGTSTKLANWRQSSWSNILHNPVGPLVDIVERDTWEPWDNVFNLIADDILKLSKNWSSL